MAVQLRNHATAMRSGREVQLRDDSHLSPFDFYLDRPRANLSVSEMDSLQRYTRLTPPTIRITATRLQQLPCALRVTSQSLPFDQMSSYDAPPPSKASLLKWWKAFTKNSSSHSSSNAQASTSSSTARPRPAPPPYQAPGRGLPQGRSGEGRVFGVSLEQSLKYANVAISMIGPCVLSSLISSRSSSTRR